MCRCVEWNQHHVISRRLQLVLLAARMTYPWVLITKRHPRATCDVASSSVVSQRRGGMPSKEGQFTRKYQTQWRDDLSMPVCLGFNFFFTYNIIYEQLINILLILFIFMYTNIEAAQTITSAFKSSMKIPLFQSSQVSKHPEWRPNIDAWFLLIYSLFLINYFYNFISWTIFIFNELFIYTA